MAYRLPDPAGKAQYVREKFDEIARVYDLFNDLITQGQHRHWKNVLVGRVAASAKGWGVDLCCGTGDISARLMRRLAPGGGVIALDFSRNMLRLATSRLRREGDGKGSTRRLVLCGDAQRIPFHDGSLAFVSVGYGLRNLTDLEACLTEIHRVLAPGGLLASLDVGKVRAPWLRPLADFYLFRVVPRIGRLLQPGQEMYDYLPYSTVDYPDAEALRKLMMARGFGQVEVIEFIFGAAAIHLARKAG